MAMAGRRTPLAPKNVDLTAKSKPRKAPKSLVPTMDRVELLELLKKINEGFCAPAVSVNIVETDLTNPTPERVEMIYLMLVNVIAGVLPSSLNQMPFSSSIDHPELYDGTLYVHNFLRILRRILDWCVLPSHDFGPHDLTDPSPKRTQHFFTALVNYIRFSQSVNKECGVVEHLEKTAQKEQELQQLKRANMDTREKIRRLKEQKVVKKELEEKLINKIALIKKNLADLQQLKVNSEEKLRFTQQERMEAQKRLSVVDNEVDDLQSRLEELKLQVVSSPEELEEKLSAINDELEEMKSIHDECLTNHNMWEMLSTKAGSVLPIVHSVIDDISELSGKAISKNEKGSKFEENQDVKSKCIRTRKECLNKQQNIVKHLKLIEEERMSLETGIASNNNEHRNQELENEIGMLEQELSKKAANDAVLVDQIHGMKSKIEGVGRQHELSLKQYETMVHQLKQSCESYQSRVKTIEENI